MKTLSTLLLLSFVSMGMAQAGLPSIDQVYKNTLANEYVYKALKEDYGIANPKECKFEKRMTIGGGDVIDSDWSTYKSGAAQKQAARLFQEWPDDRAYTVFTVTTPKNKDGVSYVLPLTVEYSRYKDGRIVDKYEYYWWKFETPYETIGRLNGELFFKMTLDTLKNLNYKYFPGNYPECPKALLGFYKINSIYESPEQDQVEKYSNRERLTRIYYVSGDYIYMPGSNYDTVHVHYKNRVAKLSTEFTRELDDGKPIADWKLSKFTGGWGLVAKEGEKIEDYAIRPTIERFGWDKVYQKENKPIGKAYFSDSYQRAWKNQMSQLLNDLYNGEGNAANNLQKYVKDKAIIEEFKKVFDEIKSKMCYLKLDDDGMAFSVSIDFDQYSNPENKGTSQIYYKIKRDKCSSDKALKNKYKEAGMAKDLLKAGGDYYKRVSQNFELSVKDYEIILVDSPKLEEEIPF